MKQVENSKRQYVGLAILLVGVVLFTHGVSTYREHVYSRRRARRVIEYLQQRDSVLSKFTSDEDVHRLLSKLIRLTEVDYNRWNAMIPFWICGGSLALFGLGLMFLRPQGGDNKVQSFKLQKKDEEIHTSKD